MTLAFLSVSVSRTIGRKVHLGSHQWQFFSPVALQVSRYGASTGTGVWWQEAKEGWEEPKRQDQFQSSWSHDPPARQESLRESQPSVPGPGCFEVGSRRLGGWDCVSVEDCACVSLAVVCVPPWCLCLWRGMGGLEVNDSNTVTSSVEMRDWGRDTWHFLCWRGPACLLVPNELSDSINERTEYIIIISKGGPGSKQLTTLAGLTLVKPFDQHWQWEHRHTNACLLMLHNLEVKIHVHMQQLNIEWKYMPNKNAYLKPFLC